MEQGRAHEAKRVRRTQRKRGMLYSRWRVHEYPLPVLRFYPSGGMAPAGWVVVRYWECMN